MTENRTKASDVIIALTVMGLLAYIAFLSLNVSAAP